MHLPPEIATLRGSEFLTMMADFAEAWAMIYEARSRPPAEPNPGELLWADAFRGFQYMALQLRLSQEAHIARMKEKRAKGEKVYSETDQAVDAATNAARSAFIRGARERAK